MQQNPTQQKYGEVFMQQNKIDLVNGPLPNSILRFTLPIMGMGLMQNIFIACDDMLTLGIFASDTALAAVGATTYLVNLFVNVFIGLSIGVNVIAAQSIGAKDDEQVTKIVHTALTASAIFGLLLVGLGVCFSGMCLHAMHTPEDILAQSALYLRIYFFSTPATLVFTFGAAILRASGDSKSPFLYLTISGFVDIVLNIFFVTLCHMDVAGVALGTILSQMLAAGFVLRHLMREQGSIRFCVRKIGIHPEPLKDILRVGIPTGMNNMVFSISNTQIQSSINIFGSAAVAGCAASATMESFVYASTNSVMQTAISFVGQNVGAKKREKVPKILKWCLLSVSMIGLVVGGLVFSMGIPLLPFILDDSAAVDYAMMRSTIVVLPYFLCGLMEVFAGTLRGLRCSMLPTMVTLIGACVFRIIWIHTVFQAFPRLEVLFLSFPISWILTAAAHFLGYLIVTRRPDMSIQNF